MGTLVAIPLYLLMPSDSLFAYGFLILLSAILGVWICEKASQELGVHDHPGIVWDEFVGFWITMWALPATWTWVIAGFVAFRFYDILKPWPVSYLDRSVHGGLGIMVDDMLAGVMACLTLHLAYWLV